jgi:hypothetical protein
MGYGGQENLTPCPAKTEPYAVVPIARAAVAAISTTQVGWR